MDGASASLFANEAKTRALTARLAPLKGKDTSPEAREARYRKLKEVCTGLETVFVESMVKSMRGTLTDGLFQGFAGSDIYDSMVDENLSTYLSSDQGIGVGQLLFNQLVRREELEDVAAGDKSSQGLKYRKIVPAGQFHHNQPGMPAMGAAPVEEGES